MDLEQLQTRFQHSLLSNDNSAVDLIVDDNRISSPDRLKIYQEAYRLRLEEAMQENFVGLHYLLGDDAFHDLCFTYIDGHPSRFTSVRWYGETLNEYLRETEPYRRKPLLFEMADYEWKLLLAFDATEVETVTEAVMGSYAPELWPELVFGFHPSVQRAEFKWSVVNFHRQVALHEEDHKQEIDPPAETDYPVSWMIWRMGITQRYRSLDVDEAWAVDHAMNGANFGDLCAGICEWIDPQHAAARAAGFLKGWLNDGLLTEVRIGTVP